VPSNTSGGVRQTFGERLAEIGKQRTAAALGDLAPAQQRIELGAFAALVRLVGRGRVHHLPQAHNFLQSEYHPGHGRLPVTPRTAGFLVVGFDALRQIQVGDEAYVGFVDAHAERDRRDHNDAVVDEETPLVLGTRSRGKTCMVRQRIEPVVGEPAGDGLCALARHTVDDACVTAMIGEETQQLGFRVALAPHDIADIGTIKTRDKLRRVV
jgi:hypothetical protein